MEIPSPSSLLQQIRITSSNTSVSPSGHPFKIQIKISNLFSKF